MTVPITVFTFGGLLLLLIYGAWIYRGITQSNQENVLVGPDEERAQWNALFDLIQPLPRERRQAIRHSVLALRSGNATTSTISGFSPKPAWTGSRPSPRFLTASGSDGCAN